MSELGINVAGRAEYSPEVIAATGARWVRCVAYPDANIDSWLARLQALRIRTLLVLARESFDGLTWQQGVALYQRLYTGRVTYVQVGNEPDQESESSWTMSPRDLNKLLALVRSMWTEITVVGPGLVSGNPSWLTFIEPALVDAYSAHIYGQRPEPNWPDVTWGFGYADDLLSRYSEQAKGKPVWVTEVGLSTSEVSEQVQAEYCRRMMRFLARREAPGFWFCLSDGMV